MAEKEVPARGKRRDAARFLILRPADTIPPVDVEVFALKHHILPGQERLALLQSMGRFTGGYIV